MVIVTLDDDMTIHLPETLRDRLGLQPGMRLALEEMSDDRSLRLHILSDEVKLIEKEGVWVICRPGHAPDENWNDSISQSREERLASLADS